MEQHENFIDPKLPDWVVATDIDKLFGEYTRSGSYVHQILNAVQFRYIGCDAATYRAIARSLPEIEDVEYYSNLTFTFDPAYEKMTLHTVKVLRNGTWIDKLEGAKIDTLRREEELNRLVFDGRNTLSLILYDIRVGDLLYYDYSRDGVDPTLKPYYSRLEYINNRADIYRSSIRALFDPVSHEGLDIRYYNQSTPMSRSESGDMVCYELISNYLEPLTIPDDAPAWYDPWSRIHFTNVKSWSDVNEWARGIYHEGIYRADSELSRLTEECRQYSDDQGEQIVYALFYVQEQIRYFADGTNLGGLVPIDPNKSLEMRFADCKNKVVILKSILDQLGVESYPVLVHTKDGASLPQNGPDVTAFNHMIIQVVHNGKKYWFDATFTGQAGDIDHVSQPDYRYALVLREGEDALTCMTHESHRATVRTKQTFDLRTEENTLTTVTTYTDARADTTRSRSRGRKIKDMEKNYIEYMQKLYPQLRLREPLAIRDDKKSNTITVTESYYLGNIWEEERDQSDLMAFFECYELRSAIHTPDKGDRKAPLDIPDADVTETRLVILPYPFEEAITTRQEENPFFSYQKEESYDAASGILTQIYSYKVKKRFLAAEEIAAYRTGLDNIYTTYKLWHWDPYDKSRQRAARALPAEKQTIYIHSKQFFDLRQKDVSLRVVTRYFAHEAYMLRRKIQNSGVEALEKEYTEYYLHNYPNMRLLKPFEIEDDDQDNILMITEEYDLGHIWRYNEEFKGYIALFVNDLLSGILKTPENKNSKEPFELKYPSYTVDEREILLPFAYNDTLTNIFRENDFFSYEAAEIFDRSENLLIQKFVYQTKVPSIPPEHFAEYTRKAEEVSTFFALSSPDDPYDDSYRSIAKKFVKQASYFIVYYFALYLGIKLIMAVMSQF